MMERPRLNVDGTIARVDPLVTRRLREHTPGPTLFHYQGSATDQLALWYIDQTIGLGGVKVVSTRRDATFDATALGSATEFVTRDRIHAYIRDFLHKTSGQQILSSILHTGIRSDFDRANNFEWRETFLAISRDELIDWKFLFLFARSPPIGPPARPHLPSGPIAPNRRHPFARPSLQQRRRAGSHRRTNAERGR